jgi:uncharacterized protein (TIGR03083 family)
MTTTATGIAAAPRTSLLDRDVAKRLAATEYGRFAQLLESLTPEQWNAPSGCPPWDVRMLATHLVGMAEMAASLREQRRQTRLAGRRAAESGALFIDALTALQVEEKTAMAPAEVIAAYRAVGPKAARARARTPGFIRRRAMPVAQRVGDTDEAWTIGYLVDVVLTRDPWLHRIDIVRATGATLVLTAEHDGVIVDDAVREWAQRHGQSFSLRLTGPAGGFWAHGEGGPEYELSVVDFCVAVTGRAPAKGLLGTQVPF